MRTSIRRLSPLLALWVLPLLPAVAQEPAPAGTSIRAGLIGLDTSHVIAFTRAFHAPDADGDLAGIRVVAGFPGGSPDIPSSADRVEGYTHQLREMGVEIVDSIPALLERVDVVLLESVDGRPHLEQVLPVFRAAKPVFIDKPLAGSLADCLAIQMLAEHYNVPWFTSSSLRFSPGILAYRIEHEKIGRVTGCDAWGPSSLEPHHPDLFWYGVHGVETLYTIMGPGCETVTRGATEGTDLVTGAWADGRIGTFRGIREGRADYGAMVFGEKGIEQAGSYEGYTPLLRRIGRFFRDHQPPVSHDESIEIFTFMEAADESKRRGGAPVKLAEVLAAARAEAHRKVEALLDEGR